MAEQRPMMIMKDDIDSAAFRQKARKIGKVLLIIAAIATIAFIFYELHRAFPTMDLGG